jgi:hypothetical protein
MDSRAFPPSISNLANESHYTLRRFFQTDPGAGIDA